MFRNYITCCIHKQQFHLHIEYCSCQSEGNNANNNTNSVVKVAKKLKLDKLDVLVARATKIMSKVFGKPYKATNPKQKTFEANVVNMTAWAYTLLSLVDNKAFMQLVHDLNCRLCRSCVQNCCTS